MLVYAGAIDNSPDGEGESPSGGKLVNYVEQALDDVRAGKPVRTTEHRGVRLRREIRRVKAVGSFFTM